MGQRVMRVLVVDDEYLIMNTLEEWLKEQGHRPVCTTRFEEATAHATAGGFDAAILDVNINGLLVWPVVERLKQHGTPFILTTGYNEASLPDDLSCPVLTKPFRYEVLGEVLSMLVPFKMEGCQSSPPMPS